jgi:large subunit ribosomal protein L29
MRGMR